LSLIFNFLALQLALSVLLGRPLEAAEIDIHFKTAPMAESLVPNQAPTDLSLLITGADGRPLERGTAFVRLEAPQARALFSTDVPLIEGTVLSEMRLPLRQGKVSWKYLFPIRGEYHLHVEVQGGEGLTASKSFRFTIRESRQKWLALGGFSLGLFLLGLVAGRIFTDKKAAAAILLMTVVLATVNESGEAATEEARKEVPAARLEIEPATVGKPSRVHWSLADGGADAKSLTALTLTITQLEDNKTVFALQGVAVAGEFGMRFHFTDGSEHRVTAIAATPGREPIKSEKIITVTAVEPPLRAMIPAMVFFLALIALGLAVGRLSKRCLLP
jgi:hypothetical protein